MIPSRIDVHVHFHTLHHAEDPAAVRLEAKLDRVLAALHRQEAKMTEENQHLVNLEQAADTLINDEHALEEKVVSLRQQIDDLLAQQGNAANDQAKEDQIAAKLAAADAELKALLNPVAPAQPSTGDVTGTLVSPPAASSTGEAQAPGGPSPVDPGPGIVTTPAGTVAPDAGNPGSAASMSVTEPGVTTAGADAG